MVRSSKHCTDNRSLLGVHESGFFLGNHLANRAQVLREESPVKAPIM
ncbi:MAG: hypothetical protein AAFZ92_11860 [Pseudomonadota bacterium]